jgi:hypothetical protein
MSYRIGITGSAGTGKSTLAILTAQELGISHISSKSITQEILASEGFDYASGEQVECFLSQNGRPDKIMKKLQDMEAGTEQFVTDRMFVDLAAYAITELYDGDSKKVEQVFNLCKSEMKKYTHVIVCPWGKNPIKDNRVRTLNPWYQFIIHSIEVNLLDLWDIRYYQVKSIIEQDKLNEILAYIKRS